MVVRNDGLLEGLVEFLVLFCLLEEFELFAGEVLLSVAQFLLLKIDALDHLYLH